MTLKYHPDGPKTGISSGSRRGFVFRANFIGALMLQQKMGPEAFVITIFPDDRKKASDHRSFEKRVDKTGFF